MSASLVYALSQVTLAASAAVLLVSALRKPLRGVAGARIAYWLWLAVPFNALALLIALLLPRESSAVQALVHSFPSKLPSAVAEPLVRISSMEGSDNRTFALLVTWVVGALVLATVFGHRQRVFVRSLGRLTTDSQGNLRSGRIRSPMLLGALRPRVVVPAAFERLYSEEDRLLMLAHELAHHQRFDAFANLFAAAWLCFFWFNPLMYWALGRFRFDQELACDALVISRAGTDKKRYANALLNAQLISESFWRVPVGCHWQSTHPLNERVAMLKRPLPGSARRLTGIALTILLTAFSVCAVASSGAGVLAQSSPSTSQLRSGSKPADTKIAIDARDTETRDVLAMIARKGNRNILVSDQVTGKITVHLKDVTWREALNIVVLSGGLVARDDGNITIVDVTH